MVDPGPGGAARIRSCRHPLRCGYSVGVPWRAAGHPWPLAALARRRPAREARPPGSCSSCWCSRSGRAAPGELVADDRSGVDSRVVSSSAASSSTSGTPRQRLAEDERRRQIMTAAVQELADRGYDGTSLTRVAERAGVSKGLLWHYFAGKDDLMEATARATIATVHRPHRALGQPAVDCSTSISRSS